MEIASPSNANSDLALTTIKFERILYINVNIKRAVNKSRLKERKKESGVKNIWMYSVGHNFTIVLRGQRNLASQLRLGAHALYSRFSRNLALVFFAQPCTYSL